MNASDPPNNDLRSVPPERFWQKLTEVMQSGLLTYRYLGRKNRDMHDVPHDSMVIRRDMRTAAGGLAAAPLMIGAADAGGFTDFDAVPAPVVASLTILDPGLDVREVRIDREILRKGRSMGFTRTRITDAANPGRLLALTGGVGVKLADTPEASVYGAGELFELPEEIGDRPDLPPLTQVFGAWRESTGVWCLPVLNRDSASTSGSLHIGPIHIVLEAAASELAAEASGTDRLQPVAWEVMFLAAGTAGPFRTTGEAMRGSDGSIACRLTLSDQGREGRKVAALTARFVRA